MPGTKAILADSLALNTDAALSSPVVAVAVAGIFITIVVMIVAKYLGGGLNRIAAAMENRNRATAADLDVVRDDIRDETEATVRRAVDALGRELDEVVTNVDGEVNRVDGNVDKVARVTTQVARQVGIAGNSLWAGEGGLDGRVNPSVARLATGETGQQPAVPAQVEAPPPPPHEQYDPQQPPTQRQYPPHQRVSGPEATREVLQGGQPKVRDKYPQPPFNPRDPRDVWDYLHHRMRGAQLTEAPWEPHPKYTGFTVYQAFRAFVLNEFGPEVYNLLNPDFEKQFESILPQVPQYWAWRQRQIG